jgi:iron complex outermembrane receptor protein
MDLLPEQEYISMNGTYTHAITDHIEFFADGFYSKREFERLPGHTWASLTVPSTNAFFVQPPGVTVDSYVIDYNFMNDLPQNVQTGYAETWEITPGFRFELPHDFRLEALYTYGETDNQADTTRGLDSRGSLRPALASSDPETAFDPYGLYRTSAGTLAAISDSIFLAPTLNTFMGYEARITGPLFDLPGGAVRIAAGYEGQDDDVDLGVRRGSPEAEWGWRNFKRRVDSGYVEVLFPIVGSANARPGITRLEFSGAWRYDKYDDVGSTTNPKLGFNYSPSDSLSFHGSWGTSFRAPKIVEIYGNTNNLYRQAYQDPEGGAPLTGYTWSGPNLDLQPEEATTWAIGGDFRPTENTEFSLTYFSVDYDNQIRKYLSNLTILSLEDEFAGTGVILWGAEAGAKCAELYAQGVTPLPFFPDDDPNNVTLYVDGRNRNLGVSITEGIDFGVSHLWDTASAGWFVFNLAGTYLTKYEVAITEKAEKIDMLNDIFNPLRLKARGSVTWHYRSFMTQLAVSYVNSYDNILVTPVEGVSSYAPVDIVIRFNGDDVDWLGKFGTGFSVSLEARNLFDEDPPYVNMVQNSNGGGGFDPTAADPTGQVIAVSVRKNF